MSAADESPVSLCSLPPSHFLSLSLSLSLSLLVDSYCSDVSLCIRRRLRLEYRSEAANNCRRLSEKGDQRGMDETVEQS